MRFLLYWYQPRETTRRKGRDKMTLTININRSNLENGIEMLCRVHERALNLDTQEDAP